MDADDIGLSVHGLCIKFNHHDNDNNNANAASTDRTIATFEDERGENSFFSVRSCYEGRAIAKAGEEVL